LIEFATGLGKDTYMTELSRMVVVAKRASLLVVCIVLGACYSRSPSTTPSIVFDGIPRADVGGPDKLDNIKGRVIGFQPGQQIVLYAKSEGLWWIQPFTDRPFTSIQGDSRWKNQTHLGTEYAALLVDQEYKPAQTTETLPVPGGGVVAVAVTKGQGPAPAEAPVKTLHFSGYDWAVRSGASYRGGSRNSFDTANAWTDESGALHLRVTRRNPNWISAEVKLMRSLGYGTYRFRVRDISHLEPSAVLTVSTWDGVGIEDNGHELDVEISCWGFLDNDNAQYVVQPYYIPVNIVRFRAPAGSLTHSIHWEPEQVTFSTAAGSRDAPTARIINEHVFTSGIPRAGGDSVRMNLYVFGQGQIPLKNETEVVIDKFEYLP